jgi:hypothetical protein
LTPKQADDVYDVLVEEAGASEDWRRTFVYSHTIQPTTSEFRFIGTLGMGGKFWSSNYTVSCYPEDETPERLETINRINARLADLRGTR